jgi:hypothetical protein
MKPFDEMTTDERKQLGAALCGQLSSAKIAGDASGIDYSKNLENAAKYSVSKQSPAPGAYSPYIDKTVERAGRVRTSLLTGADPRPSVMPNTRLDVTLAKVIRKLDDHYWEKKRIGLKYKMMTGSMVDYGTAGLIPLMTYADGKHDVDVIMVSLEELTFGDWTQWDVSLQPFWSRRIVMRIDKAKRQFLKFAEEILPASGVSDTIGGLDKVWADYWQASGSAAVKDPITHSEDGKQAWLSGNVVVDEYWTKRMDEDGNDIVVLGYIINNRVVQYGDTDYPDYPLCLFRNYMRDGSVLGKSETEIAKDVSDVRTEIIQFLLLQNSAFAKKIVEYNRDSGLTKIDIDAMLNDNVAVVGTDAEFFGKAIEIHEGANQLNQSQVQLYGLFGEAGDQETQTTKWLEGTVPTNSGNPAAQTQFMTQAGMQPIKTQATLMQLDGLYRFEWLMIWHYQQHLTAEMQIRIVGETDEDGNPLFITLNQDVPKAALMKALAQASQAIENETGEMVELGDNEYDPKDLLLQYAMITKRVPNYDRLEVYRLNDIQNARVDISVGDGMLALEEEMQARAIMALDSVGLALPEEPRKMLAKLPTDPETMAKLPRTQQIDVLNAQKQMLAQQAQILQQQQQIADQQAQASQPMQGTAPMQGTPPMAGTPPMQGGMV